MVPSTLRRFRASRGMTTGRWKMPPSMCVNCLNASSITAWNVSWMAKWQASFWALPWLFHYGRTFEINDLAVAPQYQRQGIASRLLEQCLAELKAQGIVGFHLITAREGVLPTFYERFGFKKEERVMLMGME